MRKRGPHGVSEIPSAAAIARRAGLDPATVWLHKFRATCATNWLRSKELGGKGWDIGFVWQQLGHDDYKSIEAYIAIDRNEELALQWYAAETAGSGMQDSSPECRENGSTNRSPSNASGMGQRRGDCRLRVTDETGQR